MNYLSLGLIAVLTYITSIILGPIIIDFFKKLSVKQVVREEGLESHYKKTGTPTMGGFIFLIPTIFFTVIFMIIFKKINISLIMILFSTIIFSVVGFIDDYKKVIKKHNDGLSAKQKIIFQLLSAIPIALIASSISTTIWIPFTNIYIDLGIFYSLFVVIIIIATTNAVNLTDGVDGLASSVTIIVLIFFSYLSYKLGYDNILLFTVSLTFALLGFLLFNKNPAKIFMGDIGSLALGGAIVSIAIFTNTLLLIPIAGVIYLIETLSVTIQVLYFKKTQKRIFRMAPIHHHFELVGWNEKKILKIFDIVTILGVLVSVVSIVPRI